MRFTGDRLTGFQAVSLTTRHSSDGTLTLSVDSPPEDGAVIRLDPAAHRQLVEHLVDNYPDPEVIGRWSGR